MELQELVGKSVTVTVAFPTATVEDAVEYCGTLVDTTDSGGVVVECGLPGVSVNRYLIPNPLVIAIE